MNKIFAIIILLLFSFNIVNAEEINYKNIKENHIITYDIEKQTWEEKNKQIKDISFIKKQNAESPQNIISEFVSINDDKIFSFDTQYEFINNGRLFGYSNSDLKLYEIFFDENYVVQKIELSESEVQEKFPEFTIIKISDFSNATNSVKIKKKNKDFKIILLNDTNKKFDGFSFISNNAKFETYPFLNGFLKISKKGLIQFCNSKGNTADKSWYILMVR